MVQLLLDLFGVRQDFDLPAQSATFSEWSSMPLPEASMTYPQPNRHAPLTVLVVDDESAMRSAMKGMLEILGFSVLESCDGMEAVHLVQGDQQELGLVISDFRMPGMNGVDTLTAISGLRPGLKGILCSGTPESECLQGRTLKDCIYLGKPFNIHALDAAVDQALGK